MKRILVVDDDPAVRKLVTDVLCEHYAVTVAGNGAEALELVRQAPPDAILLDMMMPVMDGWTFLEVYREQSQCEQIPVVVVSAEPGACDGQQLGVHACVSKPFDVDRLKATVEQLFTETALRPV
ncbi:MAG: response regulator [Chloroflexota bacterium]|nr:response regulator [Chloroflexota bacterium]